MAVNHYRVEAWSLPLATTTRTVWSVPFISGSFQDPLSDVGRGEITVRADWDRLSEVVDPDNDIGSLFRIFKDGTWVGSFFGHRGATEIGDKGTQIVNIQGAAQGKVMEFGRVENYDYPVRPTVEPDWNFGSGSAGGLVNGDFEDSEGGNDFEDGKLGGWRSISGSGFRSNDAGPDVDNADAQAGTYSLFWDPDTRHSGITKSLTLQGGETYDFSMYLKSATTGKRYTFGIKRPTGATHSTTNGFIYNGTLMAELENVARNPAANGLPGGSTDGLWQQTDLNITMPEFDADPTKNSKSIPIYIQYDHHDGSDGPVARVDTFTATGAGLGLAPWHRTGNSSIVSVFEQSTDQVHGDTYSAKVTTTAADHGIAQVVDGLTPGRTYTFAIWVYHADGSNQNFTAFLKHETGGSTSIATNTVSVPTATWTEITVTGVTDDEDITVVIRKQNASTFYLDDADLYEGQPKASWGDINQQLLDDAAVDHTAESGQYARDTLGFLDYTSFTTTLDSAGNAWTPALVEYRAVRGKRYDSIQNDGNGMGFEWRVLDDPATGLSLDIYNPYDWTTRTGGIGTDRRGTAVPAIKFGSGLRAGPVVKAGMGTNRVHVEGEDFKWDVRRDATKIGAYDTREGYEGDVNLLGDDTLGTVADRSLDVSTIPTTGIKVEIDPQEDPDVPQPYTHFFIGDTYPIKLINLFEGDKRVVNITTNFTQDTATYTVEFDQTSYTSDPMKAVVKGVQVLLDKFDELRFPREKKVSAADDHTHDKESVPDVVVAASDSRQEVINMADFVCDGADDHEEIQAAADLLHEPGVARGGRILLASGTYDVDTGKISLGEDIWLAGTNTADTIITTSTASGTLIATGTNCKISDLQLDGTAITGTDLLVDLGNESMLSNCFLGQAKVGVEPGDDCIITGNIILTDVAVDGSAVQRHVVIDSNPTLNEVKATGSTEESWVVTNNVFLANLAFTTMNGFVVSGNTWETPGSNTTAIITMTTCNDGVISGNVIPDAGGFDGITLDTCVDVHVIDNLVGGTDTGILVDTTDRSTIKGNVIGNGDNTIGLHAISLIDSDDNMVIDNTLRLWGPTTNDLYDGIILANSDRNVIDRNKIFVVTDTNKPRWGINISTSTCDDNRLGINSYGDRTIYTQEALQDLGTGTIYSHAQHQAFSQPGTLSTGSGVQPLPFFEDVFLIDSLPAVGTAPTGAAILVDLDQNGTTVYTTQGNRPTIADAATVGSNAIPDVRYLTAGDVLKANIDQVGSSTPGDDLTLAVRWITI